MHTDRALDEKVDAFMRSLRTRLSATSGFQELRAYINYAHGDEEPAALYGASNIPRLSALKRIWDPSNLFGKGCPIPLSS
jgi:fumiquinazoline A oxidase